MPSARVDTQHTFSAALTSPNSPMGSSHNMTIGNHTSSPFGAVISSKFAELRRKSSALKYELHEHKRHMTHQEQAQARLNDALAFR